MAIRIKWSSLRPTVAGSFRKAGAVGFECAGRHTGTVAVRAGLQHRACALGDVFGREVQVLVDVGVRRRGAKAVQAYDITARSDPALPAKRRSSFDTDSRGDFGWQDFISVGLRLL